MLISDDYLRLNADLHERSPNYGTSGRQWAQKVDRLARQHEAGTVLDYGCGKGTLLAELQERAAPTITGELRPASNNVPASFSIRRDTSPRYEFFEYDPAIPGKDARPSRADFVVCGDVLEHIEPECLYAVLDDIRSLARKMVLLIVVTVPASKTLGDGRNAHLIVEPTHWWLPKIMDRWRVDEFKDYGPMFMCVGLAR